MPEEYDPLGKLGTGNAYDDLVAGRTKKLKKAAAAGSGVGIFVAIIVVRVILAGVNSSSHSDPPRYTLPDHGPAEFERMMKPVEFHRPNALRELENLAGRDWEVQAAQQDLALYRRLLAANPGSADLQRLVAEQEAKLRQLQEQKAKPEQQPAGPPKELRENAP